MLSLGMEFSLRKLSRVGYEIGRFFGWASMDSLFLGAMLAISSTTIIVKALDELGLSLDVTSEFLYPVAVAVSAITTLLTPYLFRLSDPLAGVIAKRVPEWVRRESALYTNWLQSVQPSERQSLTAKVVRRSIVQIALNCTLVAAAFLGMALFAAPLSQWLRADALDDRYQRAILWTTALVASLPFLYAVYRKLKGLGMILAQAGGSGATTSPHVRMALAELIPVGAMLLFALFISALSASILPPIELLLLVGAIVTLLAVFLRKKLVLIHAKLQVALLDGLADPPDRGH